MTARRPLTHAEFIARRARLRGDMCAHRSARSGFRSNANVVKFECAPGTPGSDKQPASWAEKLSAAKHWREFASEPTNGTEYLRQLCVETAERLEAEAAALAGGAA